MIVRGLLQPQQRPAEETNSNKATRQRSNFITSFPRVERPTKTGYPPAILPIGIKGRVVSRDLHSPCLRSSLPDSCASISQTFLRRRKLARARCSTACFTCRRTFFPTAPRVSVEGKVLGFLSRTLKPRVFRLRGV